MAIWFGPKSRYDFGIASWQGWLATAILLATLAGLRMFFRPEVMGLPHWAKPAATGVVVLGFLAIAFATYDRGTD